MEDLCRRIPLISKTIFEELDNKSFVNFKDTSREINSNLKYERFYWIRVLRTYNYLLGDFKETWAKVVKGTPAEFLREIFMILDLFYTNEEYAEQKVPFSPHCIAACCGNINLYNHCVERTSDINPKITNEESTPMHFAAFFGNSEVCQFIMAKLDEITQPHIPSEFAQSDTHKLIIQDKNPRDIHGYTPLHLSIERGHFNVCKLIIANIQDINPGKNDGVTPLHLAASEGRVDIYKLISTNVQNKNPGDSYLTTPLHLAVENGGIDICKLIIKSVSNKNPGDVNGTTPLHGAAHTGHLDIFKLIFETLQDKNPADNDHNTPLHWAADCGHLDICKLIIGNIQIKNPEVLNGTTPLHRAAEKGHLDICKLIIANILHKNPGRYNGETPLHLAAEKGHLGVCKFIIENVHDKNPVDNNGDTPLHLAAVLGHLDICKLIIESVPNLIIGKIKNNDGSTPHDMAFYCEFPEICEYFNSFLEKENPAKKQKYNN